MGRHDIYLGIKPQEQLFSNIDCENIQVPVFFRKYPSSQYVCSGIISSAEEVSDMADFTQKVKYFVWPAACPLKEKGSQYYNATWRKDFDKNCKPVGPEKIECRGRQMNPQNLFWLEIDYYYHHQVHINLQFLWKSSFNLSGFAYKIKAKIKMGETS